MSFVKRQPIQLYNFNFTIEFWLYITDIQTNTIISYLPNNDNFNIKLVSNSIECYLNTTLIISGINQLQLNTWNHIAIVRENISSSISNFYIFINGSIDNKVIYTFISLDSISDLTNVVLYTIGNFIGFIDDIRITRGVARYTSNFLTPIEEFSYKETYDYLNLNNDPLFSYVSLLLPLNGTLIDKSIFNNSITVSGTSGNILYSNNSSFFNTKSLLFNGSTIIKTDTNKNNIFGRDSFTIEFWIYYTSSQPTVKRIFGNLTSNTIGSYNWAINFNNNLIGLLINQSQIFTATNIIPSQKWTHVAIIRYNNINILTNTGTNIFSLYINGNLDTSILSTCYAYPPSALSGSSQTVLSTISGQMYGNGTYVVTTSSMNTTNYPSNLFDKNISTYWIPTTGRYTTSTGNYNTNVSSTTVSGSIIYGEWVQIQLPNSIILSSYSIQARNDAFYYQTPYSWVVAGSNDGSTWYSVDIENTIIFLQNQLKPFICNTNNSSYSYYRYIVKSIQPNNNGDLTLPEIYLYGVPTNNSYPPAALSSTSTSLTGYQYGNGIYTINASSINGTNYSYNAFDKNTTNLWQNATAVYNTTTGAYSPNTTYSTVVSGSTIYGEWLDIILPNKIILVSYSIISRNDANYLQQPYTWIIAGSNDRGVSWSQIDSITANTFTQYQIRYFNITNNTTSYNQYRIIITSVQPGANSLGYVSIPEWVLYENISNYNTYNPNITMDGGDNTSGLSSFISIGGDGAGISGSGYFTGQLCNIRITRFLSRYMNNFTLLQEPFPEIDSILSLSSLNYYYAAQVIVSNWIQRIMQAGGTISSYNVGPNIINSIQIHTNFVARLLSQNLWNKIYRINTFSGDQFTSAMVPLKIVPGYGMSQDLPVCFTGAEFSRTNGITGTVSAPAKYIDTTLNLNTITSNGRDLHMAFYTYTPLSTTNGTPMGVYAGNSVLPSLYVRSYIPNNSTNIVWGPTISTSSTINVVGSYIATRDILNTNVSLYVNGTAATLTGSANNTQPSDWNVSVFGVNGSANGLSSESQNVYSFCNSRIGLYSIGTYLNPSDANNLHRAITQLNTGLFRA